MRELTQADPYVWFDALYEKLRIEDRVVANAVVIAYSVGADGHRDVLGIDVVDTESKESWTAFLRSLKKRRLAGVKLAISDAHEGVKAPIATVLQGASWQRCTVRFGRNILASVPQNYKLQVAAVLRSVFTQFSQVNAARTMQDFRERYGGTLKKAVEIFDDESDRTPQPGDSAAHPLDRDLLVGGIGAAYHHDGLDRAARGLDERKAVYVTREPEASLGDVADERSAQMSLPEIAHKSGRVPFPAPRTSLT